MGAVTCGCAGAQVVPSLLGQDQNTNSQKMTFWQENYTFIKDVYDMRHTKMAEWMENVEKAIARIMADKVYTSAEFKRERDNFHALCKDLERAEVKKWLAQILEILMAERAKDLRAKEQKLLEDLIKIHEELIPTVMKTQVMVDLYWKCYAYGDELKPHIEFLDGIMLSSTRDIAPSCVENVDELIESQEKAAGRLKLLQDTKEAWIGYAENSETIASDFEYCEDELKKRQDLYNTAQKKIDNLFKSINDNFTCMSITLPEDKKKNVDKEIKAVSEKLEVAGRFGSAVKQIEEFVANLNAFDVALKSLNDWMVQATGELTAIRDAAGSMLPEDRVARTMDLQEDIASKLEVLKANTATEKELFPQGDKPPQDAQDYKDELNRITKYITDLEAQTRKECDAYSEDVKYWAEYRTGIKEFNPWLAECEKSITSGLSKPSDLSEVKALNDKVTTYDKTCLNYIKVLEAAEAASKKMTTHAEADAEVAALKERYQKVKKVSEEWVKKVDTLMKEWVLLDNTVTELNSWVAKDKTSEGENQFSLEKMESTLGELKNIFKAKEKLVEGL